MADQDHGLDDVRELARGLRENENPGETREEVKVVLARATYGNGYGDWRQLTPRDEREIDKLRADPNLEVRTFYSQDLLTDLAEQLEARAERERELSGFTTGEEVAYREAAQLIRSLIEHGPDDGKE